jgi:hypothetical protein
MREKVTVRHFQQHRPWTYVSFRTSYRDLNTDEEVMVECWGASKICWPDKWDEDHGVHVAIERGLAWAVKELIPPNGEFGIADLKQFEPAMKRSRILTPA